MASTTTTTTVTSTKVWLTTVCSSGIGQQLALAALARGDKVIATARSAAKLHDLKARGAFPLALDVTWSDEKLQQSVGDAIASYGEGRVDVLVNNAGYVLQGAMEECSAQEVLDLFNTNVFGVLAMVRAVLPTMRAQRSGVVANIGSLAAWRSHACTGLYCATKFATAGVTEGLREEVAPLGIDVTSIDLGSFRTELAANMLVAHKRIPDLDAAQEPYRTFLSSLHGKQAGDPVKAAQLIVEILTKTGRAQGCTPPPRLALGKDCVAYIRDSLQRTESMLTEWADLVSTTDHDDVK
ncbi:Dehydrogenase [Globisporangium polare]